MYEMFYWAIGVQAHSAAFKFVKRVRYLLAFRPAQISNGVGLRRFAFTTRGVFRRFSWSSMAAAALQRGASSGAQPEYCTGRQVRLQLMLLSKSLESVRTPRAGFADILAD